MLEIIELVYFFIHSITTSEGNWLVFSKEQTHEILPVFFSIIIALEMIDSFNVYIKEHQVKVLNILLIGFVAIGRKLLTVDFAHATGLDNTGLGILIISISLSYF